ncbi:MAG: sensor histidine kinase [Syntrophomonadaceae bacterium]|nr:sensor histidine kinase [Syntrophomonadaceae bacterium]
MPAKYSFSLTWKTLLYIFLIGNLAYFLIKPYTNITFADTVDGKLDLSHYDFESRGLLSLNGEWEFYDHKLLPAEKNEENFGSLRPDAIVAVPSTWDTYSINGRNLPDFGYATYRLQITGVKPDETLALKIIGQATACKLFLDDELLTEIGEISTSNSGQPAYNPGTVFLTPQRDTMVISVQISNNTYARGGMWDAPTIGTVTQMEVLDSFIAYRDTFLLGNYLLMFLLCMTIFMVRPKNRSTLYFALLCLVAAGRVLIYGEFLFGIMSDNYRLFTLIEYLTRYWYPVLLLLLVEAIFPETTHRKLTQGVTIVAIIATCISLLVPIHVFTSSRIMLMSFDLALGLYIIAVLLFRCHDQLRWLIIFSIGLIFMFTVYDMLLSTTSIMELNVVGFYLLLLIFAFVLAIDYLQALETTRNAYRELQISSERERQAQLKFLQSQIKPNFLYNTLSAIAKVCSKDAQKAEQLILELAFYLQASFDFTGFNRMSTLAEEAEFVKNYINIEKARLDNPFCYYEQLDVPVHTQLPRLVIQPLVENAIRHGIAGKMEGGQISLRAYIDNNKIRIEVWDNGAGIDSEKLDGLLAPHSSSQGISLINIHERLSKIYGLGLTIESRENQGTRVSFVIG